MANTAQIETLDTVQGVNFLTMVAAAKVFSATKLNIAEYRLTVLGEGNALIVMFTDKDAPLGGRGSPGTRPGYQVELDRHDLRVIRSNFMR